MSARRIASRLLSAGALCQAGGWEILEFLPNHCCWKSKTDSTTALTIARVVARDRIPSAARSTGSSVRRGTIETWTFHPGLDRGGPVKHHRFEQRERAWTAIGGQQAGIKRKISLFIGPLKHGGCACLHRPDGAKHFQNEALAIALRAENRVFGQHETEFDNLRSRMLSQRRDDPAQVAGLESAQSSRRARNL